MEDRSTEEIVAMIKAIKEDSCAQDGPAARAKISKTRIEVASFSFSETAL